MGPHEPGSQQSAWRNSDERPALRPLLVAARNGQYRVLVVAYFSRWSRDAEVALRIRRELDAAGVALFFADEGFLSADEDAHERYLDEAIAAEKFSHRLSRTIKRTHAAKSERYARGDMSYRTLAREHGIAEGTIRAILTTPLYNGWAVRNRRSPDERRVATPWREDPPVSDEPWARVAQVRAERNKTAGRQHPMRVHQLAKRVFCICGRGVSADTLTKPSGPYRRYRHEDCSLWPQMSFKASVFEGPIAQQIVTIRLDNTALARIRTPGDEAADRGHHRTARRARARACAQGCRARRQAHHDRGLPRGARAHQRSHRRAGRAAHRPVRHRPGPGHRVAGGPQALLGVGGRG